MKYIIAYIYTTYHLRTLGLRCALLLNTLQAYCISLSQHVSELGVNFNCFVIADFVISLRVATSQLHLVFGKQLRVVY